MSCNLHFPAGAKLFVSFEGVGFIDICQIVTVRKAKDVKSLTTDSTAITLSNGDMVFVPGSYADVMAFISQKVDEYWKALADKGRVYASANQVRALFEDEEDKK